MEEHGAEDAALSGVSSKKDAEAALREYTILAMNEHYPDESDAHSRFAKELLKTDMFLQEEANNVFAVVLRSAKGKLNQKIITDYLKTDVALNEQRFFDKYVDALKKKTKIEKAINDLIAQVFRKLKDKIDLKLKEEYIPELSIVVRYIELLDDETSTKAAIRTAYDELEVKVITKYPQLTVNEIKTAVVDAKWMVAVAQRVQTEMDNISHRLTQRINQLAERYETPLPQLESEVEALEQRMKHHLSTMGF